MLCERAPLAHWSPLLSVRLRAMQVLAVDRTKQPGASIYGWSPNVSSWGSTVIRGVDGTDHLFVAQVGRLHGCGRLHCCGRLHGRGGASADVYTSTTLDQLRALCAHSIICFTHSLTHSLAQFVALFICSLTHSLSQIDHSIRFYNLHPLIHSPAYCSLIREPQ